MVLNRPPRICDELLAHLAASGHEAEIPKRCLEAKLVLGVCDVDQSFGPSLSCELFVPDLANFISQMADSINS